MNRVMNGEQDIFMPLAARQNLTRSDKQNQTERARFPLADSSIFRDWDDDCLMSFMRGRDNLLGAAGGLMGVLNAAVRVAVLPLENAKAETFA